jgi:hypothetical protein
MFDPPGTGKVIQVKNPYFLVVGIHRERGKQIVSTFGFGTSRTLVSNVFNVHDVKAAVVFLRSPDESPESGIKFAYCGTNISYERTEFFYGCTFLRIGDPQF